MKILIITQKVNKEDPILGFFHRWIEEFARHYKQVSVICLEKGEYQLPENVSVYSLGKEKGASRLKYVINLYRYVFALKKDYDVVFVHMNQEYVLLAGIIWKFLGKKVFLWRNHVKGNWLTSMAVSLSNKVFYTSPKSYTTRFRKALRMPVGIDTAFFKADPEAKRIPGSIVFLGRIAPIKRVLEFIDWLKEVDFSVCTIAGSALPEHEKYEQEVRQKVKQYNLGDKVKFLGAVNQTEARKLYQTHETYVNFTPSGSFDKTMFEAALCGAKIVSKNPDFENLKHEDHSLEALMQKLLLAMNE